VTSVWGTCMSVYNVYHQALSQHAYLLTLYAHFMFPRVSSYFSFHPRNAHGNVCATACATHKPISSHRHRGIEKICLTFTYMCTWTHLCAP
jgi:hypothetical protein